MSSLQVSTVSTVKCETSESQQESQVVHQLHSPLEQQVIRAAHQVIRSFLAFPGWLGARNSICDANRTSGMCLWKRIYTQHAVMDRCSMQWGVGSVFQLWACACGRTSTHMDGCSMQWVVGSIFRLWGTVATSSNSGSIVAIRLNWH